MLDDFILQQGDCGVQLLSTLQRFIHYCGNKYQPLTPEDQQEVLQETCLKLLQRHKQLKDNCKGWLFSVVRNEYVDHLRRHNRTNRLMVPDESGDLMEVSQPQALQQSDNSLLYAETDCLEKVFDHIEQQPTGEADIAIYTQHALGESNSEIAEQTGRTTGAIAKRISLLKQRLKQLMQTLC